MKSVKIKHRGHTSGRDIDRLLQRGFEAHKAGRLDEAFEAYRKLLAVRPNHPDALHLSGMVYYARKQFEEAAERIQRAIRLQPGEPMFYYNLGATLHELGRLDEAEAAYRKALKIQPNYAEVYSNLGNTLKSKGNVAEAIQSLKQAVALRPDFADAYCNLGVVLAAVDAIDEAEFCYRKALALQPRNFQTWHNLGNLFRDRNRFSDALTCFQKALEIDATRPESLNNLGQIYMLRGDALTSLRYVKAAWDIKPDYWAAGSNWLLGLHYSDTFAPNQIFEAHRHWAERVSAAYLAEARSIDSIPRSDSRIRIGYVSPDFRTHSVAYFIEPVLACHDRSRFHITAYSDAEKEDETTRRIEGLVDRWRRTTYLKDETLFETIRRDGIDILVDLAGHTANNRLVVFARKPAPIQVTYIGYPDTTGLETIDYRITDAWADPPGKTEHLHTETLVRLESGFLCYRPPETAPEVVPSPFERNGYVTFGSFNSLAKLSDGLLRIWSRILDVVPESRLLLKAAPLADPQVRSDVLDRLYRFGVDADRVIVHGRLPFDRHLALYGEMDIALDTFPYHGTTTTVEALWMGVPVISLEGTTHVSRVGSSLLGRLGLNDLIARNGEDYVQKARDLASDLRRLVLLRQGMRERIRASPLVQAERLTAELEHVFMNMLEQARRQTFHHAVGGQ